jgi:aryl-alcohol dehydrogenase-like predicted oxidoreductase
LIYKTLGRTGLKVSLLSYGTGGPRNFGQRAGMELSDQNAFVRRCLDLGINLFDTARGYAQSEAILGQCLEGVPRDSYHLITKWNMDEEIAEAKREAHLVGAVKNSLRLLKTDHIDVFMFHGLTEEKHDEAVERYCPILERFRDEGKIGSIGLSTVFVTDAAQHGAKAALTRNPELWDVVMVKYGILNQYAAKEILPLAQKHDVGVVNMAAARIRLPDPELLEQTMMEWKEKGYVSHESLPEKNPLGWLVRDEVESVVAAGYKFAADRLEIATVLTGTANLDHLEQNARALEQPYLSSADSQRLVELFGEIVEYA